MNVYMICSAVDCDIAAHSGGLRARLSYSARGNSLLAEKLPHNTRGDMMIISANDIGEYITPAIYDECRKRKYKAVFLDADEDRRDIASALREVSASLSRRALEVFCPLAFADDCPAAIPVAEAAISGGVLQEYLEYLLRRRRPLALSIPRVMSVFPMPLEKASGRDISRRELSRIIDTNSASVHFSPQMLTNYFIYSPAPEECSFVLFDDARTISEKLRLAKRLGFSDVFLAWREITDIADELML